IIDFPPFRAQPCAILMLWARHILFVATGCFYLSASFPISVSICLLSFNAHRF
ncbi:hypothetical protein BDZ89DRAFT_1087713, partial [Hymenopellis radicata]